jgi:hypothetical protein
LRRRLLLLNLLLAAAICWAGWQLRRDWLAAHERVQATARQTVKPQPPPALGISKPAQPVAATAYSEIAQKMLFSKDRNPNVVVEVQAPPPKPMPPLPLLHGVMYLGDSPTAILSGGKTNPEQVGVRPGESFGEFKLVDVSNDEIALEWDGQVINKRVDEMMVQGPAPAEDSRPTPGRTSTPAAAAPRSVAPQPRGEPAPGVDIGAGLRACQPGDTAPAGTIVGNMRKVISQSPFGESCRWETLK